MMQVHHFTPWAHYRPPRSASSPAPP